MSQHTATKPNTPCMHYQVKVNMTGFQQMPWYWMSLLSDDLPGQYYYVHNDESFVIFSGKGFPENLTLSKIPGYLNSHTNTSSFTGITCESATQIDGIPKEALPLYVTVHEESKKSMPFMRNSLLRAGEIVGGWIDTRYQHLENLFARDQEKKKAPISSPYFYLLEETANQLCSVGNLMKYGDVGRASSYVARVACNNPINDLKNSIPKIDKDATCHTFTMTGKNTSNLSEDSNKLVVQLRNLFGYKAVNVLTQDGRARTANIIISERAIPIPERPDIFLEEIITALYVVGLDNVYTLTWLESTVTPNPLLLNAKKNQTRSESKLNNGIFQATRRTEEREIAQVFESYKLSKEYFALGGKALRRAAFKGQLNDVKRLIGHFGKENIINQQDGTSTSLCTALHHAVSQKHDAVATWLMECGAKTDIENAKGKTAANLIDTQSSSTTTAQS